MNEQQIKRNREMFGIVMAGLVGLAITGLAIALPGLIGLSQLDAGPLGDWIAGSTSIVLQAIVIFLLVQTYRGQMKELEEQRELLRLAHEEARRKSFEDGYYMLLGRYEDVVRRLKEPDNDNYIARRVFPSIADECASFCRMRDFNVSLARVFSDRDWWLGDWQRIVMMIAKYIRESDRSEEDQRNYLKMFRGLMSSAENRLLLFYLLTKEPRSSPSAAFLLRNNFFKYSFISNEPCYDVVSPIVYERHGYSIYPDGVRAQNL